MLGPRPLFWLTVVLYAALVLPRLASRGMHRDGVVYAAIARNLAQGIGGAWSARYTMRPSVFCEHPPGAFWLQSLWFRVLGDTRWVEVLYSATTGALMLVLLVALWHRLRARDSAAPGPWFPIVLFLAFPLVSWTYANNMLENTLALFTAGAVLSVVVAIGSLPRRAFLWGGLCGLMTGGALLIKGPVGLFPVAAPVIAWVVGLSSRRAALATLAGVTLGLGLVAGGVAASDDARAFLAVYGEKQVLASVSGARELQPARFYLVGRLATEVVGPVALCLVLLLAAWRWMRNRARVVWSRPTVFCLLVALSASLPLLISPKQHGWYLVPSLPFYALALASAFAPCGAALEAALAPRARGVTATVVGAAAIVAVATFFEAGVVRKEHAFHADFTTQPFSIAAGTQLHACPVELARDWSLVHNLARELQVDLVNRPASAHLLVETRAECVIPAGCEPLHPPVPEHYRVYRCAPATLTPSAPQPAPAPPRDMPD